MKTSLLLFFLLLFTPAFAATVNTGTLSTSFSGPPAATVNASSTATVDLSSLAGLTPGHDIVITFSTSDSLLWVGGFTAGVGELTLNYQARLSLSLGAFDAQSTEAWSLGPSSWPGGGIVGYDISPSSPASFSLTVPWGTNLSAISLTLTDLSSITGTAAVYDSSSMELANATLTTTSSPVPEPSTALAFISSTLLLLRRRRLR